MPKTKTITTAKATVLVVELPEGVKEYHHSRAGVSLPQGDDSNLFISGNWQLLGRLPDITEERAERVVVKSIHTGLYAHYVKCIPVNTYCYKESADSLYSLLQANEVCFENHLGDEPIGCSVESYHTRKEWAEEWQEAQTKVWDKERTYILTKVD